MKQKTIFCCEFCNKIDGFWSDNRFACEEHEASHFNLSRKEYLDWRILTKTAVDAGRSCGVSNNPTTRAEFDKAIKALCSFEEEHGLAVDTKKPSDFY